MEDNYENHSEKFLLKHYDFQRQFFHMYTHRLAEMSSGLIKKAKAKWLESVPIKRLCDLREGVEQECIIIGTLYKNQVHKPSILRELSEKNQLAPQPPRLHYTDPDDKIMLEDELQRVQLKGKIQVERLATGVVCAAKGLITKENYFLVEEMLFCESGPQKPLPDGSGNDVVVLISGLSQMDSFNYVDSLNLFQYWLCGELMSNNPLKIHRLIIAGNSLRCKEEKQTTTFQIAKSLSSDIVNGIKELDSWFAAWSSYVPLDLMPGAYDPANILMPQQPFHKCIFPLAARHADFQSVTNPYSCSVNGVLITGTSGHNVNDLLRCTDYDNALEALRSTLLWGHLIPTAPDTIYSYPYIDSDPFVIKECPHIYFAGNCDSFDTELYEDSAHQKVRLVCVPSFAKTQSVAVVNLHTLECHEISFNSE